ncbi:MAG: FAD-binding oxidoreductase, partial [Burkholderiales bacterium]
MSKYSEGRVVNSKHWTERLLSLQVEAPVEPFKAGQFGKLALEINGAMVFRPYSFVNAPQERPLEFYLILLQNGPLTQRLVKLDCGDPIYVAPRAAGFLTLAELHNAE